MKKLSVCLSMLCLTLLGNAAVQSNVTRVVGADLSLVPAYESAGDTWLDANGKNISDMITYMKEQGLTSVRVRLLVNPDNDSYLATCQDLAYVEKLGKRIKDADMLFLLDIFYSDTWTDVSKQWIPSDWNMTKSTASATVAAKVKSYTTEVLNDLVNYGATPDYIQIGNEVSYGMLWDSSSGGSTAKACYPSATYSKYKTQWERFATLLKAAAEGVRASNASTAKIILHSERSGDSDQTISFYTYVEKAGFTDYDVIGLSYYPAWQGTLSALTGTLTALTSSYPAKEIQIVETGYYNTSVTLGSSDNDTSGTWAFSSSGQAAFVSDLVSTLNTYTNVTGLYYWQPEECGNGANSSGDNQVMDGWDNRGFWECSWKSGSHKMTGSSALSNLIQFNHTELSDIEDETTEETTTTTTDITDKFNNMDFESSVYDSDKGYFTDVPGWTFNWDIGFSSNPWAFTVDEWVSSLCDGYALKAWAASSSSLTAGNIISQSLSDLPAGTYTLTAAIHCDTDGFQLFANDDATSITTTSTWGTAYTITVETTLEATGSLAIGVKLASDLTTTSGLNLYMDNFTVTQTLSSTGTDDTTEESTTTATSYTSSIQDYDFEESVHFAYEEGPWQYGDDVYLYDYADTDGYTGQYTVGTDEWAANTTNLLKLWGPTAITTTGSIFYQTVTGLPNGTYTLSADICDQSGNLYLFGGDAQSDTGTGATTWSSVNRVSVSNVTVTDGTLKIGIGVDGTKSAVVNGYVDNFDLVLNELSEDQSKTLTYTYEGIVYTYNTGTQVCYVSGYVTDELPTDAEGQDILGSFTVDDVTYYPSYIADWAMNGYPLYWITIPSSISNIGKGAFYQSSLYHVTFYANGYLNIWDYAFTGWDDSLEDGNTGSKGNGFTDVTFYVESMDNVNISSTAFCSDDIKDAELWVNAKLTTETAFNELGFNEVYPIDLSINKVTTVIEQAQEGEEGATVTRIKKYVNKLLDITE